MSPEPSILERNQAELAHLHELVAQLSDADLIRSAGEGWTVSVVLAHMAFWDRRAMLALERSERDGKVWEGTFDDTANDVLLPFLLAIPPREAARLALASADAVSRKIEACSSVLLEQVAVFRERTVVRAIHWADHLGQIERALQG